MAKVSGGPQSGTVVEGNPPPGAPPQSSEERSPEDGRGGAVDDEVGRRGECDQQTLHRSCDLIRQCDKCWEVAKKET